MTPRKKLQLMVVILFGIPIRPVHSAKRGHSLCQAENDLSECDVRIFGYWELGTAAGLVGGPAIASALAGTRRLPTPVGPWAMGGNEGATWVCHFFGGTLFGEAVFFFLAPARA